MNEGLTVLTFEGTSNNAMYDMTVEIPEGKTLVLKQARFEIAHTLLTDAPRVVNVAIGTINSTTYVIDNDAGYNYLKVGLDYNPIGAGPYTNISVTYPDTGFKMSGRLNKIVSVVLLDGNHQPLTGLNYFFMQFIVA